MKQGQTTLNSSLNLTIITYIHSKERKMLILTRILNLLVAVVDALIVYALLTPTLHKHIPREFQVLLNGKLQADVVWIIFLVPLLNGLIRFHGAIWVHDKTAYRLLCWSWVVECAWWAAEILYRKKMTVQEAMSAPAVVLSVVCLVLCTLTYKQAVYPSTGSGGKYKKN